MSSARKPATMARPRPLIPIWLTSDGSLVSAVFDCIVELVSRGERTAGAPGRSWGSAGARDSCCGMVKNALRASPTSPGAAATGSLVEDQAAPARHLQTVAMVLMLDHHLARIAEQIGAADVPHRAAGWRRRRR